MTAYLIVFAASIVASGLTLYSGFGLGTLLLPVYSLFFPLEVAVAATAVVHGANNAFKIGVVGKYADRSLVTRFGIPAIIAALIGAALLGYVAHFGEIARYSLGSREAVITPIKLSIALLMLVFALFELLPSLRKLKFDRKYLFLGGLLSGFFGGFSGHQGALRSAFLAKVGVSPQAFVGTNAVIGFLVDMVRIAMYAIAFLVAGTIGQVSAARWPLIATGIVAAFAGVLLGKRYLHKMTMDSVQAITGAFLLGIAIALGLGIV
ncbi:MAG: TSUP family transporter [Pseudomonadota bacterium]